jgi:hypothetical protein
MCSIFAMLPCPGLSSLWLLSCHSRNAFAYLAKQGTPLHIGTYVYPLGMIPVAMFPEEDQCVGLSLEMGPH